MDPYRGVSRESEAEPPRDPGIVGDVIAQFADPLAFYRELVQNAIDAGTPSVEIRIEHDEPARIVRVAVRDRGEGMTREVIEEQLLVLFRSTKEHDRTKIGKFGIGFASVLAPSPEVVAVHTARGGRRLTLHLHRDLTYQLFDGGPATQTGTTVELELAMAAGEVGKFVAASLAALERWCRHASVPIEVTASVPGQPPATTRIDRPLGLDGALVEVRGQSGDGELVAVAGLPAGAAPYTGLFNHGLMLHETSEPLLGCVAVKLQDRRLGHTLSRDNVRRDEAFARAIAFARELVERELPAAVAAALREAADAGELELRSSEDQDGKARAKLELRSSEDQDGKARAKLARHRQLVAAVVAAKLALPRAGWWLPLAEPLGERRSISADQLGRRVWAAAGRSQITALLAAHGEPVLDASAHAHGDLAELVHTIAGCTVVDVADELTCVTPVERSAGDDALLALLGDLLAAAYRAPPAIILARLTGVHAAAFAIGGDPDRAGEPQLVDRERALASPFARLRRPALVLSADHAWVRAARAGDPRLAASHLARQLLLHHRILEVARGTTVLDATLDLIGIET